MNFIPNVKQCTRLIKYAKGKSKKQVAQELDISPSMVALALEKDEQMNPRYFVFQEHCNPMLFAEQPRLRRVQKKGTPAEHKRTRNY